MAYLSREDRDAAIEKSIDAAIQIEGLLKGLREDIPAFYELLEILFGSAEFSTQALETSLTNSSTASLYRRAWVAATQKPVERVAQLQAHLIELLDVPKEPSARKQLENLRDFCVSLNAELVNEAFERVTIPAALRGTITQSTC
jgi:hypothetical protein